MVRKLILPLTLIILLLSLTLMPILSNRDTGAWSPFRVSSVYAQSSQITVDGADATLNYGLQKSDELNHQAAIASPRILVEYADSILNINLERPVGIIPAPSQPTPTTTTPGPTPNPTPTQTLTPTSIPTTKPGEVSVYLYGQKTAVNVGEDIILSLSAVNLITKPTMTVQLILKVPSGMSITSSEFIKGGGGQYTASYDVEPGDIRQIEVHIMTNQIGNFNVVGEIYYYFGSDKEGSQFQTNSLPVTVNQVPPNTTPSTTPANNSGSKGVSGTMLAIIIGVCTATVGGVLARVIYGRMRAPVPVKRNVSDELRPSPKNEQPNLKKETKVIAPLAPDHVPEEKILDIKEGQKGINQDIHRIITNQLGSKIVDSLSQQVLDELIAAEKNYQKKEESSKAIIDLYEAVGFCLQQYYVIKVINKARNITRSTQQPDFRLQSIAVYECSQIFTNIDDPNPDKIESSYIKRQWSLIRDATTQAFPKFDKRRLTLLANNLREIQKLRNRHAHKESEVITGPRPWHEDRRDLEYMRNMVLGSGQKVSVIVEIVEMFK